MLSSAVAKRLGGELASNVLGLRAPNGVALQAVLQDD